MTMKERVLLLSPHTDDVELGCAASVSKFLESGYDVITVLGSSCKESLPANLPPDTLIREFNNSMKVLGVQDFFFLDLPVRYFPEHRQLILEKLVEYNKKIKPTLIMLPCSNDIHQDHSVFHNEGLRAFKFCKILGYELTWNTQNSVHSCHIKIEQRHLDKKIECMRSYESQKNRPYFSEDFIRSLAKIRGIQAGSELAESFELIKWFF